MLSLLEQCYELPDEHFLSVAMFYNDSTEAQSFQASSDFCAVPTTKETDLEQMNPGSARLLSSPPSPAVTVSSAPTINACSRTLSTTPRVSSPGMASSVLPRVTTGYHEVRMWQQFLFFALLAVYSVSAEVSLSTRCILHLLSSTPEAQCRWMRVAG